MLFHIPIALNVFKAFRQSHLSLVSYGTPSTNYSFRLRLYQSLCVKF